MNQPLHEQSITVSVNDMRLIVDALDVLNPEDRNAQSQALLLAQRFRLFLSACDIIAGGRAEEVQP